MHYTMAPDNMTEAYSFITTQTYAYFGRTNKLTSLVYHLIRWEIITHRHKKRQTLLQIMLRCNLSICLIDSKIQAA